MFIPNDESISMEPLLFKHNPVVVLNARDLLGLVDITLRQASGASALFRIKSSKYLKSKTKNDAEMKGQTFSHHFTIFVFATSTCVISEVQSIA